MHLSTDARSFTTMLVVLAFSPAALIVAYFATQGANRVHVNLCSQVSPEPRKQQLAREMEDRIDYATERESGSTSRSMPQPPPPFPASAAWDYLVSSRP